MKFADFVGITTRSPEDQGEMTIPAAVITAVLCTVITAVLCTAVIGASIYIWKQRSRQTGDGVSTSLIHYFY